MRFGAMAAVAAMFMVGTAVPALAAEDYLTSSEMLISTRRAPVGADIRVWGQYSSNQPITCVTDFGDGQVTTGPCDVTHAYSTPGNYIINQTASIPSGLTKRNGKTVAIVTKTGVFSVTATARQIGPLKVEVNFEVVASDWSLTTGEIHWRQFFWTAGQADRLNPSTHVYETPGHYDIRVLIRNTNKETTETIVPIDIV